ncbi:MAG: phosphatase PAP2 family protein [Burkholderiales bacterium]
MSLPVIRRRNDTRFWAIHAGAPAVCAMLLLLVFETGDLDVRISNLYFDVAADGFPLKRDWFLEVVMHQWAKYVSVLVALGGLAGFVASFWVDTLRKFRRALLFVFLCLALSGGTVAMLKTVINKHCPWDLEMYGGYAPYVRLLEHVDPRVKPGECFPAGHATAGFGLMSLYFLWFASKPRWAFAALLGGFIYGNILGLGRIIQGAHFLSHNLWAALVAWCVALLLYRLILYPQPSER